MIGAVYLCISYTGLCHFLPSLQNDTQVISISLKVLFVKCIYWSKYHCMSKNCGNFSVTQLVLLGLNTPLIV